MRRRVPRQPIEPVAQQAPVQPEPAQQKPADPSLPQPEVAADEPARRGNPLLALALGQLIRSMSKPESAPPAEDVEPDVPPIVFEPELSAPAPDVEPPSAPAEQLAVSESPPAAVAMKEDFRKLEDGKKEAIKLYSAGRDLMRQKRYGEAAVKFEQAIVHRSDAVASYISLGNCYLRLNRNDQARSAFLSAVRIEPSYGPAHYNLAAFYALTGDSSCALTSLQTAVRLDPKARRLAADEPDFASIRKLPQFERIVERR